MANINKNAFDKSGLTESQLLSFVNGTIQERAKTYERQISKCDEIIGGGGPVMTLNSQIEDKADEFDAAYTSERGTTKTKVTAAFEDTKEKIQNLIDGVKNTKRNISRGFILL